MAPGQSPARTRAIVRRVLSEAWSRLLVRLTGGEGNGGSPAVDPRVSGALTAIESRYADPRFRLHRLARDLGVSPTHLTQLLKRDTGHTFGGHLHLRRIAEAQRLLSQSGLSIKEIAARVGYMSSSQLDRHFKRRVRCAPSVFRARVSRAGGAGSLPAPHRLAVLGNPTQTATLPQK